MNNIYFPFDVLHDTAIDVATELVKELQCLDWDLSDIADMIENEVATIASTWINLSSPKHHHQESFIYEEEYVDGEGSNHPFYAISSSSSSDVSLPQVNHFNAMTTTYEWLQGNI